MHIHLVVCLTTGPKPLLNRALHIVRSRASSFICGYPLLSLRSSSSFLRFLPRLPVTSIPPLIFPSITRCRRQFLRRMWPIQLAFRFLISCRIFFCSLTLSNTGYWILEVESGNTRLHGMENSFWKRQWVCHKTDSGMTLDQMHIWNEKSFWVFPYQRTATEICHGIIAALVGQVS